MRCAGAGAVRLILGCCSGEFLRSPRIPSTPPSTAGCSMATNRAVRAPRPRRNPFGTRRCAGATRVRRLDAAFVPAASPPTRTAFHRLAGPSLVALGIARLLPVRVAEGTALDDRHDLALVEVAPAVQLGRGEPPAGLRAGLATGHAGPPWHRCCSGGADRERRSAPVARGALRQPRGLRGRSAGRRRKGLRRGLSSARGPRPPHPPGLGECRAPLKGAALSIISTRAAAGIESSERLRMASSSTRSISMPSRQTCTMPSAWA